MGLDPAEPGLRAAGVPPPERSAGGGGHPAATRLTRRGSMGFRQIDPWNCSAGEDPLPEPFRTELPEEPRSEGPKVLRTAGQCGQGGLRVSIQSDKIPAASNPLVDNLRGRG